MADRATPTSIRAALVACPNPTLAVAAERPFLGSGGRIGPTDRARHRGPKHIRQIARVAPFAPRSGRPVRHGLGRGGGRDSLDGVACQISRVGWDQAQYCLRRRDHRRRDGRHLNFPSTTIFGGSTGSWGSMPRNPAVFCGFLRVEAGTPWQIARGSRGSRQGRGRIRGSEGRECSTGHRQPP